MALVTANDEKGVRSSNSNNRSGDSRLDPRQLMRECLDPPSDEVLDDAVDFLEELGACEAIQERFFFSKYNRCDKIAADDEEYVDANKAATEQPKPRMKKNHRDNGNSSQAVYFRAVTQKVSYGLRFEIFASLCLVRWLVGEPFSVKV